MTNKHDPLTDALGSVPAPPLDARFAERTLTRARTHLAPAPSTQSGSARLRFTLAGALVPGLLASAAADRLLETVATVERVYGNDTRVKDE